MRADKTSKCFLRRTVRDHIIPITYAHAPFNTYAIACELIFCYLTYPIFSGSEARGCDCYFCEAEKTGQNCKHIINGAKHLHRYLGR
ncbi:unnamed protein product [Callosobruchus maculatus]|uniref:SWIM-type domain-containing protein n=1 Tax=Callosobruchus maculatus TaxID=64391 RepID=A0A653D3L8_CALMS|nr:unnamed protein product [Callosobruchus maculatus]